MPAAPSEPENYSIDEMMERLRNAPAEAPMDGERVIRADGTEAIRVRKRKRRSSQPIKEARTRARRARIVQASAALVLVFVAAIVCGAAIIYANSSPFREGLIRKIQQASGAVIELQQFRMNPKTANAGKLSLAWPADHALKDLTLHGLNAEIFPSSFLGKSFTGEDVSFTSGALSLQIPKGGMELGSHQASADTSSIQFKRYRCPRFQITLGDEASPLLQLTKSEASLSLRNNHDRPQATLYRGDLAIQGWSKLRLDRALFEFNGRETEVIGLRVLHETDDRGTLEFTGTLSPYQPKQPSTLKVNFNSFLLSGITGPDLGHLVSGRVDSMPQPESNVFSFQPGENPRAKLDLAFRSAPTSQITIQGFPFLSAIGQSLDDLWYLHPVFDETSSGIVHRENGVISLRDLNLTSKNRMALKGHISLANQTLSGELEVGITEAMIATAPASRLDSLFGPPKDGFRWITLKISGSPIAPTDSFKELYAAAPVPSRESGEPAKPSESTGSTFEELTRPK